MEGTVKVLWAVSKGEKAGEEFGRKWELFQTAWRAFCCVVGSDDRGSSWAQSPLKRKPARLEAIPGGRLGLGGLLASDGLERKKSLGSAPRLVSFPVGRTGAIVSRP
jgi:hypothetical protein